MFSSVQFAWSWAHLWKSKICCNFSTQVSRYWQLVLLDFFILCQFNSRATPTWSDITTIIVKQTQLSPSRTNTYTILLTTIIHPSNSCKLHSASRRFYTYTFLSIRSHRHRQMGSLRHLHPTRPLSISRLPNLRSNRVPNRANVGILSPPRIHETLPSPPQTILLRTHHLPIWNTTNQGNCHGDCTSPRTVGKELSRYNFWEDGKTGYWGRQGERCGEFDGDVSWFD